MGCTATVWERAACRHVVRVDGLLWPLELWDCSCGCPGSEGDWAVLLASLLLARFPQLHAAVSSAPIGDDRAKTVELRVTRLKWSHWT